MTIRFEFGNLPILEEQKKLSMSSSESSVEYDWETNWKNPVFDHFLLYCDNLDEAIDKIENLTGVRPTVGGKHVGKGTHNAIVSLSESNPDGSTKFPPIYLELIAKDPEQTEFKTKEPVFSFTKHSSLKGKILHWAAVTPRNKLYDWVDEVNANAAWTSRGWPELKEPCQMERQTPDNKTLQWMLSLPTSRRPLPGNGLLPFLLDWQNVISEGIHPGQTGPKGIVLKSVTLRHPKFWDSVKTGLDNLGLFSPNTNGGVKVIIEQSPSEIPSITLNLQTPKGEIDLSQY